MDQNLVDDAPAAPVPVPAPERPASLILRRLLPFLKPYSGRIVLAMGCLLLAKLAGLAVPMLLKRLIDDLGIDPSSTRDLVKVVPVARTSPSPVARTMSSKTPSPRVSTCQK